MTKQSDQPHNPGADWHKFNPFPDEDAEGNEVKGHDGECETCGEDEDALVHQVDEAGNPTEEAQRRFADERSDVE
jgi:hypothetical protein